MTARRDRRHGAFREGSDFRSPFARDRDQIEQSPEFQRLRHVTQVMAPAAPGHFHNRLTHSREVARIGRALALALLDQTSGVQMAADAGGLDPAVVEAASLAHDLGHPPFGHDAEDELNMLLTAAGVADGFEANAQSFRIVTTLATDGKDGVPGLNLTRATLAAILKYPWRRGEYAAQPAKWGAYASEAADLAWARALMPPGGPRPTLEAEVMDWADLVAYAVLDFEDFARAGLLPLDRLETDLAERERFLGLVCHRRRIAGPEQADLSATFARLLEDCPVSGLSPHSRTGRNALRCFCHHQIDEAIGGAAIAAPGNGPSLQIDPATRWAVFLLEGLTWHYVIDGDLLKPQREAQRRIIRGLFARLADAASSPNTRDRFPAADRERLEAAASEAARLRVVADVIASMREDETTIRLQATGPTSASRSD